MSINNVTSKIPGGLDAEITITFLTGSAITTAVGSTATAKFKHPSTGAITSATSATVTGATTLRVKLTNGTLTTENYHLEIYLTAPASDPVRVWDGRVAIKTTL